MRSEIIGVIAVSRRWATALKTGGLLCTGLVSVALYVWALWRAPEFLVNQDVLHQEDLGPEHRLSAEHSARLIVISIGGALVVLAGLLYTARSYRLAHRGQVSERFTKALERLGADELYARVVGVHALERVMRDSAEHHPDVVRALVAFIRDRAPRRVDEPIDQGLWMHPPIGADVPESPSEPAVDVQAALAVLGRRPKLGGSEQDTLDFHELHLQRVRLPKAQLNNANLGFTQLQYADLRGALLQGAFMKDAQLHGAVLGTEWFASAPLRRVPVQGAAQLQRAILKGADLSGAELQGAVLRDAHLQGASLKGAQLWGADLRRAHLQGAILCGAQLLGADLRDADLRDADLRDVELRGADLRHTNLRGADLRGVDLRGAYLRAVKLEGADLQHTMISTDQRSLAAFDEHTPQPDLRRLPK